MAPNPNDPYASRMTYTAPQIPHSAVNLRSGTFDDKPMTVPPRGPDVKTSFYPLSLVVIAFWIVLIAGEVILLEKSVAVAPTKVTLPWYYSNDGLPSILFTIFAQGHKEGVGCWVSCDGQVDGKSVCSGLPVVVSLVHLVVATASRR